MPPMNNEKNEKIVNKSKYADDVLIIKSTIEKIRPFMQREGGDISFVSYDQQAGIVKVQMIGACNGCFFAGDEISMGVETILEQELPSLTKVEIIQDNNTSSNNDYPTMPGIQEKFPNGIPLVDPLESEEEDPLSLKNQIKEARERINGEKKDQ